MDIFEKKQIAPMLIAHNKPAFDDENYIYELKWDGVRCVAYLDRDGVVLRNKRNKDVTVIYPELSQIHKQVRKRCILDGEVFCMVGGKPAFAEMQRRALMTHPFRIQLAAEKLPVSFVAFDLLYLDKEQHTLTPLIERKAMLQNTVKENERLAVSRYVDGQGIKLYEAAAAQGLEGIVAKRKNSLYFFGKETKDWIKCKALLDDDFIVCGYYFKGRNFISVILGQYVSGGIAYQSHVVMGVSKADFKLMEAAASTSKGEYYATFPDFDGARWLEPALVCRVEFMERTRRGGLRQPVFRGLRDDKAPEKCIYIPPVVD